VTAAQLHLSLDFPLPEEIEVGAGTALFLSGTCFSPEGPVASLELEIDGESRPVAAHGMPRLDFFRELHPRLDPFATAGLGQDPESPEDPALHGYRSGFWTMAVFRPGLPDGERTLTLHARLSDGRRTSAALGAVHAVSRRPPPADAAGHNGRGPHARVAIAMATYNPPPELLRRQLDSIRAQTVENWVCCISDDRSNPEAFAALRAELGDDPRFVVSRSSERLGFYRNFERALAMVPADVAFVALADQDDAWHADKLATLLAEIGDAPLAYSDARIVARDGRVIAETYWSTRANNHSDLTSLLVANAVTGAASLLRRDLLDSALPFPPAQFAHFHDHWIGLVALALGDIVFVDRPLYDYVQHGEASLGHAAANRMTALRSRITDRRPLRERVRMWRLHYFVDACRLLQLATILELRCGSRMSPAKRRALDRYLAADRSLTGLTRLGARGARELLRERPETLGAEWMLFHAFLWRRLLSASARERPQSRLRLDAVPPPTLALEPARSELEGTVREVGEKIAPLRFAPSDTAPQRVNLLIPTIDLAHFFGGYITKLNLARRLAERGVRVRIVTVDPVAALPPGWKRTIESYSGLAGLFDSVEVVFARGGPPVEVSRSDGFIATTWWSAHIAAEAVRELGGGRFVYLIQEYEPFTFPMGSYAALAQQSYGFPHFAVFSSELLRDYFRRHDLGVFAAGRAAGDRDSVSFQNAITPVTSPTVPELSARSGRRLLFYARPEPHAARNMFELGVLALARAAQDGVFGGWELRGVGSVTPGRRIPLGGGAALEVLPRSDQAGYAAMLREHDVGLALMYTPHPSLVPIEMASAGMVTVTNSFENKDASALAAISPNLLTVEPSIPAVAAGLAEAVGRAEEHAARVRGSEVAWCSEWDESFDDDRLEVIAAALGQLLGERTTGSSRRTRTSAR
jgi:glycosyltransferase involved in cell wall biosynthesis